MEEETQRWPQVCETCGKILDSEGRCGNPSCPEFTEFEDDEEDEL